MGAKLTKSKNLLISEKTKVQRQQEEIVTTVENTNNHVDITTNEANKPIEKNKNKKKQEQKLNKKSSKQQVDKSTNTENYLLLSSSCTEQLVGDQLSSVHNNVTSNINTVQVNGAYQPEVPNSSVQEFQDACFQNSFNSSEDHGNNQRTLNEQKLEQHNQNLGHETTNNPLVTSIANSEQIHNNEQQ